MKKIPLSNGGNALVSDEDFDNLSKLKWLNKFTGYNNVAVTSLKPRKYMHSLILNPEEGLIIDHINGNGLDNQRTNLRAVTPAQNARNTVLPITNTSGYKGVVWSKAARKWNARINVNYKRISLGYFIDIKEAAKAYNKAAVEHFGEYANLNHID